MSVQIHLEVGDDVPLSYQIPDDNSSLFVRAFVKDETGTAYGPYDLTYDVHGRYVNLSDFQLPNKKVIFATYIPYVDAGFTNEENSTYSRAYDVFQQAIVGVAPITVQPNHFNAGIGQSNIQGKIEQIGEVEGQVNIDQEIDGQVVENETIEGENVGSQNIEGEVND